MVLSGSRSNRNWGMASKELLRTSTKASAGQPDGMPHVAPTLLSYLTKVLDHTWSGAAHRGSLRLSFGHVLTRMTRVLAPAGRATLDASYIG